MAEENSGQEAPKLYYRIEEWFPELSADVKSKLRNFYEMVLVGNRSINLVSAKAIPFIDALHFADSILASRVIMSSKISIDKIYDLGTGAGFPGLVFAILYPNVQVVLVDFDLKKVEFLKSVIAKLGINNVTVEMKNIEHFPENSIKYAMARGLSSISKSILVTRKSIVKGGTFFHLKGEEWGIEVGEIPSQLCSIWFPALMGEYKLPVGEVVFGVVKTDKIA